MVKFIRDIWINKSWCIWSKYINFCWPYLL